MNTKTLRKAVPGLIAVALLFAAGVAAQAKPTGAKGTYVQKVAVSSTMGPGVRVDVGTLA